VYLLMLNRGTGKKRAAMDVSGEPEECILCALALRKDILLSQNASGDVTVWDLQHEVPSQVLNLQHAHPTFGMPLMLDDPNTHGFPLMLFGDAIVMQSYDGVLRLWNQVGSVDQEGEIGGEWGAWSGDGGWPGVDGDELEIAEALQAHAAATEEVLQSELLEAEQDEWWGQQVDAAEEVEAEHVWRESAQLAAANEEAIYQVELLEAEQEECWEAQHEIQAAAAEGVSIGLEGIETDDEAAKLAGDVEDAEAAKQAEILHTEMLCAAEDEWWARNG
jgi:hypothetical protein